MAGNSSSRVCMLALPGVCGSARTGRTSTAQQQSGGEYHCAVAELRRGGRCRGFARGQNGRGSRWPAARRARGCRQGRRCRPTCCAHPSRAKYRWCGSNARFAAAVAAGQAADDTMLHVAGLERLEAVFCYPESGDLVIAGPAAGWVDDPSGSRRFDRHGPARAAAGRPGCGLAHLSARRAEGDFCRLHDRSAGSRPGAAATVPAHDSAFGSRRPARSGGNADRGRHRREFGPGRDSRVRHSGQHAFGGGTRRGRLSHETDWHRTWKRRRWQSPRFSTRLARAARRTCSAGGSRRVTTAFRSPTTAWAWPCWASRSSSTRKIKSSVRAASCWAGHRPAKPASGFAAASRASTRSLPPAARCLPNCGNRSICFVAAAFIRQQDYYGRLNWDLGALGDEARLPTEVFDVPRKVACVANARWQGGPSANAGRRWSIDRGRRGPHARRGCATIRTASSIGAAAMLRSRPATRGGGTEFGQSRQNLRKPLFLPPVRIFSPGVCRRQQLPPATVRAGSAGTCWRCRTAVPGRSRVARSGCRQSAAPADRFRRIIPSPDRVRRFARAAIRRSASDRPTKINGRISGSCDARLISSRSTIPSSRFSASTTGSTGKPDCDSRSTTTASESPGVELGHVGRRANWLMLMPVSMSRTNVPRCAGDRERLSTCAL